MEAGRTALPVDKRQRLRTGTKSELLTPPPPLSPSVPSKGTGSYRMLGKSSGHNRPQESWAPTRAQRPALRPQGERSPHLPSRVTCLPFCIPVTGFAPLGGEGLGSKVLPPAAPGLKAFSDSYWLLDLGKGIKKKKKRASVSPTDKGR